MIDYDDFSKIVTMCLVITPHFKKTQLAYFFHYLIWKQAIKNKRDWNFVLHPSIYFHPSLHLNEGFSFNYVQLPVSKISWYC